MFPAEGQLAGFGTMLGVSKDQQCGWGRMHEGTTVRSRSERREGGY